LINSSDEVSPFLPSITNQSINYSYGANNVSLGLVRSGDVQVMFHGSEHALTRYIVSAVVAVNGSSYYGGGTISAFQSGLIYAVVLNTTIPASVLSAGVTGTALPSAFGGFAGLTQAIPIGLSVTLLSTSLPLSAPSASTSNQAVSAGIGIGVAASAVGLGLGVRRRNKHEETSEGAKPEHWVD